jgi:hypothetical protein
VSVAELPLDEAASVVLNAAGNGSVKLGPRSSRITWNVTAASVRASSNVLEPTAILYQNSIGSQIAGTYTGSNDSTDLDITVRNGFILCVWSGGDAGARATLYLQGSQHIEK